MNYQNDSILFPYDFKVINKRIIGYKSKKAPGKKIDMCFKNQSLEQMSKDIIQLEKDILKVSSGKICMSDVNTSSIFYDGNKFSMIDVDYYYISHLPIDEIFYKNIKRIKCIFFELIRIELLKDDCNKEKILNELRKYCIYEYEINQMLLDSKYILEYYCNKTINRLEDMGDNNGHMYIRNNRSR